MPSSKGISADRLSIAGWIPSGRPVLEELARRWDVLVVPPDVPLPPLPPPRHEGTAWNMAQQLLDPDRDLLPEPLPQLDPEAVVAPSRSSADGPVHSTAAGDSLRMGPVAAHRRSPVQRPGWKLDLSPPASEASRVLQERYRFAREPDRRWLDPEALSKIVKGASREAPVLRFDAQSEASVLLRTWVRQVREQCPAYAAREQWDAKVDLLRSAALVLVPERSTVKAVGLPERDSRVPGLLFGLLLETRNQRDFLGGLGPEALHQLIDQSLSCRAELWAGKVRRWLVEWRSQTTRAEPAVRRLIEEGMRTHPPQPQALPR